MTETEAKPRILETAEEVAPPAASSPSPERKKEKKHLRWSNLSYTTRVTLAFALIAAMTALVAIGVVSFVWEQHFRTYTADNMQTLCDTTADRIAAIYEETGDLWNPETTRPAAQATELTSGVGVRVIDLKGSTVFDSSVIIDEQQGDVFKSFAPQDTSQVATAYIKVDGEKVGTVRLWVYGSEALMRQPDQEFRDNSQQAMFIAGGLAIVLASCIGFLFARNLVSPINRIMKTARAIGDGDLSARTHLTGEDEVARLGETFDVMAESVEKDRDLERRLTTDVAHELRTPLMAIQATVEAMIDGVYEADEERLVTVNSEIQRLSRLVNALLKLSRLENRAEPMKEEVVNVGELISGIVATHEMFVSDSGLTLEYDAQRHGGGRRRYDPPGHGEPDFQRRALHAGGRPHHGVGEEGRHHGLYCRARHRYRPFQRGGSHGVLALLACRCRPQPRERRPWCGPGRGEGDRRPPRRLGAGGRREGQGRLLHHPYPAV